MNEPLVSIIIPVYNTFELYLRECISSVQRQTYKNIEVLIIDDGSQSTTKHLCDKFMSEKIKVIHTSNHGVSSARNRGIDEMSGDYVMFLDADDILSNFAVEQLVHVATENNASITIGRHTENIKNLSWVGGFGHSLLVDEAIESLLYDRDITASCFARLIEGDLAKANKFNIKFAYAEDLEFNFRIIQASQTVSIIESKLYYYRQNPDSVMQSSFNLKRMQGLEAVKNILNTLEIESPLKNLISAAKHRYFLESIFVGSKVFNIRAIYKNEFSQCIGIIKETRRDVLMNNKVRTDNRLLALLAAISPIIAVGIYSMKLKIKKISKRIERS